MMGDLVQFPGSLPLPFSIYQRKGFVECEADDAEGWIEHTRDGDKRHWLRTIWGWMEVSAAEYLEAMREGE